jgi:hypothetical protein
MLLGIIVALVIIALAIGFGSAVSSAVDNILRGDDVDRD